MGGWEATFGAKTNKNKKNTPISGTFNLEFEGFVESAGVVWGNRFMVFSAQFDHLLYRTEGNMWFQNENKTKK